MSPGTRRPSSLGPVGIVGLGVVGATIRAAFDEVRVPTRGYDLGLGIGSPRDLHPCAVSFLCVGTPGTAGGEHDLTQVRSAVREIEPSLREGAIVAVKSTVPPGTCDRLASAHPRLRFVSAPEFLIASRAMESFRHPDRLVIGARTPEEALPVARLLSMVAVDAPVVFLSPAEAELMKLCANAMLAAKVIMANELAAVCGMFGVDWSRIREAVGLDPRIGVGHTEVTAERGFGGQCLPKDLDGLISASAAEGYRPRVLEAIAGFNRRIRAMSDGRADVIPPVELPEHERTS